MMEVNSELTLNQAEYDLPNNGKGKVAVFVYTGGADPKHVLDRAVSTYVDENGYHELIDAHLDNPWMRVIISDINSMEQKVFDPKNDRMYITNG